MHPTVFPAENARTAKEPRVSLYSMPTTAHEAKAQNKTYYLANRECPVHRTRHHWAGNGGCMACVDIDGQPHMVRPTAVRIRRGLKGKEAED